MVKGGGGEGGEGRGGEGRGGEGRGGKGREYHDFPSKKYFVSQYRKKIRRGTLPCFRKILY